MADESEKPKKVFALVNIDTAPLGDAAKLFVEKMSDAIGGIARPSQIRRIAEAEADATLTEETTKIQVTSLHRRAAQRWFDEEAQKQANMEAISALAVRSIQEGAKPNEMDADWMTQFFDRARLVSNGQMQALWAKILAGEANAPGAFSKQTLNTLAQLEQSDAEIFQRLCRFSWFKGDEPVLFIGNYRADIYANLGVTWESLTHLSDMGLVFLDWMQGHWLRPGPSGLIVLGYHGKSFALAPNVSNGVKMGNVKFSRAGAQLARVCGSAEPVEHFVPLCLEYWKHEDARVASV
jgi:uncharacterized repeat protein (TIGR03899 family)